MDVDEQRPVAPLREEEGPSLRDTLNVLYKRKFILTFLNIALPLGALLACFLVDPIYESTAKVMVTAKKENATLLQTQRDSSAALNVNLNVDEIDLNSEMEVLRSLDLWIRTIKKLNLDQQKKPQGILAPIKIFIKGLLGRDQTQAAGGADESVRIRKIAENSLRNFKVTPVLKSRVLDLSYRDSNPALAQQVLQTLLELYVPYHLEVYALPGAQGFFSGQGDLYKTKYDEADQTLADFKKRWGISLPEKQKSELITTIRQIEDSLVDLRSNLSQYEFMISALKQGMLPTGQLAASMQRGNENTVINIIVTQLLRAEQKQLQSTETFSRESRDNRATGELVSELRKRLLDALNTEVSNLTAKRDSLDASLKAKQNELQVLEEKAEEARRLSLDVTIAKERYLQYISKEEEARLENLKAGKHMENVSIVARPFLPSDPIFPKTLLYVLGALFASFPLGIGLILLVNFFDHTFANPADVKAASKYDVLASIGKLRKGPT